MPNQKTQTGKLDKMSGNPSHAQGHTQAQNNGMEEDLPSKWRAKKKIKNKKKQELQSQSLIKQALNQQRLKETKKRIT